MHTHSRDHGGNLQGALLPLLRLGRHGVRQLLVLSLHALLDPTHASTTPHTENLNSDTRYDRTQYPDRTANAVVHPTGATRDSPCTGKVLYGHLTSELSSCHEAYALPSPC